MKYLTLLQSQTDTSAAPTQGANDSLTKLTEASVNSKNDSLTEPTKLTIPPEKPLLSVMSVGSLPISTETGDPVSETVPSVIEVTFKPCKDDGEPGLIEPGFPPCPQCGTARYWVSRGYLRCGSKACRSAPRFALIAISYRPIN
jgi:hypothetical protein